MNSPRKNKPLVLNKSEYELFCLIKEGMLGPCTHLMDEAEVKEVLEKKHYKNTPMPYTLSFSPNDTNDFELIKKANKGDIFDLMCEGKCVGKLELKQKFQNPNDTKSIFNPNHCFLDPSKRFYFAGKFELFSSHIKTVKQNFKDIATRLNAKKITALVSSLDPLHRAHERMFRWTMDKADLVVIFLIESYEKNGLDFDLKKSCLELFIQNYLPKDKIFIFPLKNIDIFHAHLNPALELIIAKSLACTKLVVGQNHTGLGMFYDQNQPKTIFDSFSKDLGLEVIVLPEFVFCDKCKISVSTRSCPHGSHHHVKFHSSSLKDLLRMGIIPPTIFIRREISAIILADLFPNRIKNLQKIYNDLFPSMGIFEQKSDREFYEELLKMYQMTYMV